MEREDLKTLLSGKYPGCNSFRDKIILQLFGEDDFENMYNTELLDSQPELQKTAEATGICSVKEVGKVYAGIEPLYIFDITVSDSVKMERNRVGIQKLVRMVMDQHSCAFMIFHYKDNDTRWDWRFTFCYKGSNRNEITDSKRYTFLLGPNYSCRTATDNFMALFEKKGELEIKDIEQAFSVEALSKQFYKELFDWYQWAVDPKTNVSFPNDTTTEDDDRENIETKIIRMITRVMFVWFIKQKGLVPSRLFDVDFLKGILRDFDPDSSTKGDYYNAILQNLFFATLNRAIKDEEGCGRGFAKSTKRDIKTLYRYDELFAISEAEVIGLFAKVPFLNGGLFECLDKTKRIDGVESAYNYDGFSRNDKTFADGRYKNRAVVPNVLFFDKQRGLIPLLSKYNFTVEENSPEEQKVALDPELLGKVFENLLGAYNPETKETARNQSGSFYTPREIVGYMVDESLIAYLGDTPFVRSLFGSDFEYDDTRKEEYEETAQRLKAVKVLDPACGSGAFPMGLLNRMVDILQRIEPDGNVYEQKLAIIENCIYGSDIQCIAAQITKLRFFISLICDCEKDESKPNYGIPVLPNLETNFVAANSLIAKKKEERQLSLFADPVVEEIKNALHTVRHDHFSASSAAAKSRLRKKDQELREKLADRLADANNFAPDDARQLAEWNPYDQNNVSPFFDPEWMFGIADGFDIVIGNPPYVQLQNNGGELAKIYQPCEYSTFAKTGDEYCLFYERGWQLLKNGGHLCYITSNKWMRAGYGEKTRSFLATKTNPKLLVDFAGVRIFESATVDTNVLLFSKSANEHKTRCAVATKENSELVKRKLDVFVRQQSSVCDFPTSESWVILSPIEQSIKRKIEAVGTPLKDWDIKIYRGVLTGYNDAFIITTEKRDEILAACASEEERERTEAIIRPILRGRDIKRYGYEWAGLWVINTHNGIKGQLPRIDVNDYPAVKAHLDQFWDKISTRTDKGDTPYNLRNCAYWGDFLQRKIVYAELARTGNAFAYDGSGRYMVSNTGYILTVPDNNEEKLIYLLAFLNSRITLYCLNQITSRFDENGWRWLHQFVEQLRVPKLVSMDVVIAEAIKCNRENQQKNSEVLNKIIANIYKLSREEEDYINQQLSDY